MSDDAWTALSLLLTPLHAGQVPRLHPSPGFEQMSRALEAAHGAMVARGRPETVRAAMVVAMEWATTLRVGGQIDDGLWTRVGEAYATTFALDRSEELERVPDATGGAKLRVTHGRPSLVVVVGLSQRAEIDLDVDVVAAPAPRPPEATDDDAPAVPEDLGTDLEALEDDDWRLPPDPAAPPSRVVLSDAPALDLAGFRRSVAQSATEKLGPYAREHWRRPADGRAGYEERLLHATDAIFAAGASALDGVLDVWRASLDLPSPFTTQGAVFALARIDGPAGLLRIRQEVARLPLDSLPHVAVASRGLGWSDHPGLPALARDLSRAAFPPARALGISLASRLAILRPEDLGAHLADPSPLVATVAAEAIRRLPLPEASYFQATLWTWLGHPDARVALASALTLARFGDDRAMHELRRGGALLRTLGTRALDIIALAGRRDDLALFETIAARAPTDEHALDALARFGHPGAWAFLVHHLEDDELRDDAVKALVTLFGELVPDRDPRAWRTAIAAAKLDPSTRYRAGRAFGPQSLLADTMAAGRSAKERASRVLDMARMAPDAPWADPDGWSVVSDAALAATANSVSRVTGYPGTGWR